MQRPIDAFAKEDVVDKTVALKQLHLGRFAAATGPPAPELPAAAPSMQKIADVELALRFPLLKNLQHIGVAARHAEGSQARAIHVFDQSPAAGFQLIGRDLGKFGGHGARGCDVALDHARGLSGGVAHESSL